MLNQLTIFNKFFLILSVSLFLNCKVCCQNLETLQGLQSTVGYLIDEKVKSFTIDEVEYEMGLYDRKTGNFSPYKVETTGSCFFVLDTISIPELDLFYLVTAAHVAKSLSKNSKLVVRNLKGQIVEYQLKDIMHEGGNFEWYIHPEADVAVGLLNIEWIFKVGIKVFGLDVIEPELKAPSRVDNVVMMGFPLGLGANKESYSPISTFVNTASGLIDLKRTDNQKISTFFLLDKPSAEGFSGGPVSLAPLAFLTKTDSTQKIVFRPIFEKCVGLVHGTYSDGTGGKFAAIVPSKYIFDTFKMVNFNDSIEFVHSNGVPWTIRRYKNSKLVGIDYVNDLEGKPLPIGSFNQGNGELLIYDENDKNSETWEYRDGIRIKVTKTNLKKDD